MEICQDGPAFGTSLKWQVSELHSKGAPCLLPLGVVGEAVFVVMYNRFHD